MEKLLMLSIILALAAFAQSKPKSTFKFEDCSKKGSSIVEIKTFHISPDPISLSSDIVLSIHGKLHKDIPPKAVAKRKLTRKVLFGFPISIPCMFDIGSCTTPHCKYMDGYKEQMCPFFPSDAECGCPITAGDYVGHNITVPMPDLGAAMKWLASGHYKMEVKVVDPDTKEELICFNFEAQVKA